MTCGPYLVVDLCSERCSSAFIITALQFGEGSKSTWSINRFDFVWFSMQASKNVLSWDRKKTIILIALNEIFEHGKTGNRKV